MGWGEGEPGVRRGGGMRGQAHAQGIGESGEESRHPRHGVEGGVAAYLSAVLEQNMLKAWLMAETGSWEGEGKAGRDRRGRLAGPSVKALMSLVW